MAENPPLILTLKLNQSAFVFFNELRKKHFPQAINYLDAHLTLFHHLPDLPVVTDFLSTVAANQAPISLEVTKLIKLGRGVAYSIDSPELNHLHNLLQKQWTEYLTLQDQQRLRPHVTVQNKVIPETANILFSELTATFTPFAATGEGFSLWAYLGGPWRKIKDFLL